MRRFGSIFRPNSRWKAQTQCFAYRSTDLVAAIGKMVGAQVEHPPMASFEGVRAIPISPECATAGVKSKPVGLYAYPLVGVRKVDHRDQLPVLPDGELKLGFGKRPLL